MVVEAVLTDVTVPTRLNVLVTVSKLDFSGSCFCYTGSGGVEGGGCWNINCNTQSCWNIVC